MKEPRLSGLFFLADEGCGSEHKSRDKRCHARIRQNFTENSGHCTFSPVRPPPISTATLRPLRHHGEKVNFFELVPLNTHKKAAVMLRHAAETAAFAKS
jgi:hypothetical protein